MLSVAVACGVALSADPVGAVAVAIPVAVGRCWRGFACSC